MLKIKHTKGIKILSLEEIDELNQDDFNEYIKTLQRYKYRNSSKVQADIATWDKWKRDLSKKAFSLTYNHENDLDKC